MEYTTGTRKKKKNNKHKNPDSFFPFLINCKQHCLITTGTTINDKQ